jgi:hypothetical protein
MITRALHGIMGKRLAVLQISPRQKGFVHRDGCAENIWILDKLIKMSKRRLKELNVAFLDIARAFPSVSHDSILNAAQWIGLPEGLLRYIRNLYAASRVRIAELTVPVRSGILQGDPLSGYLFNYVMLWCFEELNGSIGFRVDQSTVVNYSAFADDTVLFAGTRRGLQTNLDQLTNAFAKCGLSLNPKKCATLTWNGRSKETMVHRP